MKYISENKHEAIRKGLVKGESYNILAKTHHVSKSTISKIKKELNNYENMLRNINKENQKNLIKMKTQKMKEENKKVNFHDVYKIHQIGYYYSYNKPTKTREQEQFEEFKDEIKLVGS